MKQKEIRKGNHKERGTQIYHIPKKKEPNKKEHIKTNWRTMQRALRAVSFQDNVSYSGVRCL
jgi:hypothetical protein